MKRLFDLFFAILGLIFLLPLFAFVSLYIKIDSPGAIFYSQERVGQNGKSFKMIKFRTMVTDADKKGLSITVGTDPRITRVGHFLRKYKLDELPQLLNVIKGDMSLVGPRPEVKRYVDVYTPEQKGVLNLMPGITDPASIKYRNENELLAAMGDIQGLEVDPEYIYIHEIMPDKITINLEYADRANVVSDFKMVIRTIIGI
jgi:lipopolysaccharide/colanic/teichoic acid biosynthesis glycosyltransferase